ncbi:dihydrofolate reductase [Magnetospirillum molischianum]|uniref:dihydrofolate reductase n=1 Tax=Magnetospirillum molischianum TaxID=1083 RepID=UPI003899137F
MNIIVAASQNGVIGYRGVMPWHIPDDLRHFKATTMGHPVIMGRKTWESIGEQFGQKTWERLGKQLPGRLNIVLTSAKVGMEVGSPFLVNSLERALVWAEAAGTGEAFIIGGAAIYELAMPLVERIYLTEVHRNVVGDAYFPNIDRTAWREVSREDRETHSFVVFDRAIVHA